MKVASYNIHKCRGTDGRTRPSRILEVIKELDSDLIALQEVDKRFGRRDGLLIRRRSVARPECDCWSSPFAGGTRVARKRLARAH